MFNAYYVLKYFHIISSLLMVGTGFGSALYVFIANRSGNLQAQYFANRTVVFLDWVITTPTVIIQPITGIMLAHVMKMSLLSDWFLNIYLMYIIVGAAWLPVVWLQVRMKQMTDQAVHNNEPLNPKYQLYQRTWEILGYIGFSGAMIIFFLMVTKMPLISLS